MQEFSSISVSSYDAAALAERLTESSADGWEVVSIVAAGTNVVAYLARPAATGGDTGVDTSVDTSGDTGGDEAGTRLEDVGAPEHDELVFTLAAGSVPEEAAAETALSGDPATEPAPPVEPAGWGTAPEAEPTVTTTAEPDTPPEPEVSTPEPEPVPDAVAAPEEATEPQAVHEDAGQQPGAEAATGQATQTEQATQTVGAAPAGWYADPAGRYELRYWDGNQWTEHVSRAGQQYTDPPVA